MFRWDATEVLASIPVPMLVLTGSKDIVTLPAGSQTISEKAPQARLVEVAGGGHMGFMECAADYNRAIESFVDGLLQSTASIKVPPVGSTGTL